MKEMWKDQTYIGFDTETTGRFPLVAEICELAAVKWRNGKVIDKFESFVKPIQQMGEAVIRIHHITNEMVADAPPIKDVLPKFHEFISDGSILIAHHAPFDMGFLTLEYEKLNLPLPINPVLCSCLLARKLFPKFINHRLATLVHNFEIKVGAAHRALDDSRACLEAGLRCMEATGALSTLEHVYNVQGGALMWPRYSIQELINHSVYGPLVEASQKQIVLEITYEGGSRPGVPRKVTPLGMVRNPDGDFLVGMAHDENKEKRYFLNRISKAKILD